MRSRPSIQSSGSVGVEAAAAARGSRSGSATRCSRRISSQLASFSGFVMCSACQSSAASMTPEAFAAARVSPLPCETATERALGRTTITTGMPMRSRPVTLATRVMPMPASSGRRRARVSSGAQMRCVPRV